MAIIETIRNRLTPQRTVVQTNSVTQEVTEIVNPTVIEDLDVLNPITQIVVQDPYAVAQGFEAKTPSSAGTKGDVSYNNGFYYICYNTNQWARVALQINNFIPIPESFSIYGEEPTGVLNGINKIFTVSQVFVLLSTRVFLNGLRMKKGATSDYQELGNNQIEFITAPRAGSQLLLDYDII